ncbi:PAN2-PAN3 deadenylation complex catalytic subunit PAN2 [Labeo rohita]|uniref:PAN2-PAN3 deadenylation complex catalytic subunit PAN2 n=1 Tax=Labeo rohita TaxID=84645 RepID=A0ABQ8N0A9_LABRO|nr:PAN2-PAN3 deadenylation complex catalytic subunit PAN2 [Labeo rohita]
MRTKNKKAQRCGITRKIWSNCSLRPISPDKSCSYSIEDSRMIVQAEL